MCCCMHALRADGLCRKLSSSVDLPNSHIVELSTCKVLQKCKHSLRCYSSQSRVTLSYISSEALLGHMLRVMAGARQGFAHTICAVVHLNLVQHRSSNLDDISITQAPTSSSPRCKAGCTSHILTSIMTNASHAQSQLTGHSSQLTTFNHCAVQHAVHTCDAHPACANHRLIQVTTCLGRDSYKGSCHMTAPKLPMYSLSVCADHRLQCAAARQNMR